MKTTNSRYPDAFNRLFQQLIILKACINGLIHAMKDFDAELKQYISSVKQQEIQK